MIRLLAAFSVAVGLMSAAPLALADGAIICRPESTAACKGRQYCCYAGPESEGSKYCKALGCVRGGTASCPSAANVSSCGTRDKADELDVPWCPLD
jgi:hypothetical protein